MKRLAAVIPLLVLFGSASPAWCAQLLGRIADSQNTPISNVMVSLTDAAGHRVCVVFSNTSGVFRLDGLKPGDYRIQARPLTGGSFGRAVSVHVPAAGLKVQWRIIPRTPALLVRAGAIAMIV